ncbi:MAG: Lumazine-binding protein [Cyanobacteria bacterium P01_D01_bin.50]
MFTGLIKETGIVEGINPIESGVELIIQISPQLAAEIQVHSHIAIDGRVLTVLHREDNTDFSLLKFYASHLNKIGNLLPKKRVNLERAVRLGEEIPGTFFYGVPSGQAKVIYLEKLSGGRLTFKVSFEDDLASYLSIKDQVCLDGVSLQIRDIKDRVLSFELYPTTLNVTTLGERQVGDLLTIEIDPFMVKIARVFQKNQLLNIVKTQNNLQ